MPTKRTFQFSPSIPHQRLLQQHVPRLRYEGGDVRAWQRKTRRRIRQLLRMPANEGWPLNVRSLWRRETDLGTIEKVVFASEPGQDVPAYWCVPRHVKPPYTAFICLQGHSSGMHNSVGVQADDEAQPMDVPGDRDFALGCMRRGMAALAIEQRSFGERAERDLASICKYNTCLDQAVHAMMLGRTAIGERVLDVDRAIDYLASRGDVDMERLGCMGNSGGGSVTMWAGAVLPRIRAILPSCCFATFASSLLSLYHCACNHVPDAAVWTDVAELVGTFAPKPCVIVAGATDEIFPLAGVREAFSQLKRIYAATDARDMLAKVEGSEGHRFYADLAWPEMLKMLDRL